MRDTIKNHKNFLIDSDDMTARCAYCLIRARPIRFPGNPQYGLMVTKRLFKHAIHRNRAKRLLREWLRLNEKHLRDDLDYILIARSPILTAKLPDGREAMRKALHYLKKNFPPVKK